MRQLASIQRIVDLQPIPNADKIETATVLGWKCVVKKGEFKTGDLVPLALPGAVLPGDFRIKSGKLRALGAGAALARTKT